MSAVSVDTPPAVYLLADHLDAALAAGEDLLAVGNAWPVVRTARSSRCPDAIALRRGLERTTVEAIRSAEMRVLSRCLLARERAGEVAREVPALRPLARLFASGLTVLADPVPACGAATDQDFATGDSMPAYLRQRGILDAEAAGMPESEPIAISEGFLVAGLVPLGVLMDQVATLLDGLDALYDLYAPAEALAQEPAAAA